MPIVTKAVRIIFRIRKMTRINSAISVNRLTDEHLLAEHREIKRMPYCLRKAIDSGSINKIPERFMLTISPGACPSEGTATGM